MIALDAVWYGTGLSARVARALLTPASWAYGAGVRLRARRYEDPSSVSGPPLPALSIGNLTVGGTGKTPVAAWAADALRRRGATPAIVMRGYGDDEPLVHARLNPGIPVVADPDRLAGARRAAAGGADCVVLDDAFQHRRIARISDWVLVSADRWPNEQRLLPAGPLREPVDGLRRADVVVVTRKQASLAVAELIGEALATRYRNLDVAVCHLRLNDLRSATSNEARPLSWLHGRRHLAVAAVGDPASFFAQLRAEGAEVRTRSFGDHHAFNASDVAALADDASGVDGVICTLKDIVKLGPLWPATAPPLWYVSQIAVFERGSTLLDRALGAVLAARQAAPSTAGPAGHRSLKNGPQSSTAD